MPTTTRDTWQAYGSSVGFIDVARSIRIPVWGELRVGREVLAGRRAASLPMATKPRDIVLVHGFLDDGEGVHALRNALSAAGHRVHPALIGRNVDCGEQMAQRLEAEVVRIHDEVGGPVVLVGHSRGGQLSRAVAARRPELVSAVIAVGSPLVDPFDVNLGLKLVKLAMRGLSRLGVDGLMGECAWGSCCTAYTDDLTGPFPDSVELISIASPTDGMVHHDATRDPDATNIAVDASHVGLVIAPEGLRAIADALESLRPAAASADAVTSA